MAGPTPIPVPALSMLTDCRLCGCRLMFAKTIVPGLTDDCQRGLCRDCQTRPEAGRFGKPTVTVTTRTVGPPPPRSAPSTPPVPRGFSPAEKSLIRSIHGYMPAAQLLDILNTRLVADVGAGAVPFTMEQLHAEVQHLIDPSQAIDWAGLRDILTRARRCGLLAEITPQLVDDFATVFQLSPAQLTHVRDVIRNAQEERP